MRKSIAGIGIVCAVGIFAWALIVPHKAPAQPAASVFASPQAPLSASAAQAGGQLLPHRSAPQGQSEYYNAAYRFSLFYPDGLSVKEYDEGGGAMTVVFQNVADAQGFQIFIVPYGAAQISDAQFRKDEPSGVRKGVQNVQIDGAVGASFYGSDVTLGETAEVWFIHGGYLYEVTAPKSLSSWLSSIMQTWKFL